MSEIMRDAEHSSQLWPSMQSLHVIRQEIEILIVECILDQNLPSAWEHNLAEIKVIVVPNVFH